jgi:nitroreductase
MEFSKLVEQRRSIRRFRPDPVAEEAIDRILRAVSRAPSAGNLQAYRVVVVRSATKRRTLAFAAAHQEFVAEAPIDLVFFADPDRSATRYGTRGALLYAIQDATIAATFAILAATDEGLSSVWVGAFDESTVQEVCGEPRRRPVAIVPIGRGSETPEATSRRALSEIVRRI